MRLRLATGVVGAVIVVGAIWVGAPWLTILALLGGGLAIHETYRLTPPGVGRMPAVLGTIAVLALLLAAETAAGPHFHLASGLVLAAWAFAAILWFIACYTGERSAVCNQSSEDPDANGDPDELSHAPVYGENESLAGYSTPWETAGLYDNEDEDGSESEENPSEYIDDEGEDSIGLGGRPWLAFLFLLLGPVYVGFLLGHGLALRDLTGDAENLGRSWLLFALLVVFACDTGAFAVGRLVGRHRMAPRLSPNKTWEGATGGFLASVGAALLVSLAFDLATPLWQQAVAGAVVSVAAQFGDLAESALKRAANAKESGSIMPGHGGILDRMDSILFALPAVYYLLLAVGFRL